MVRNHSRWIWNWEVLTKVVGNYNIVDNTLNFVEAPFGNTPLVLRQIPDERDWTGISTGSSFQEEYS